MVKEHVVAVNEISTGDILLVRPGEKVLLMESWLKVVRRWIINKGKYSVEKDINSKVVGASINKTGVFKMKVTKVER